MNVIAIMGASAAELDRLAAVAMEALWRASWQAAVIAGLVLAVQWMLGDRLSARWRHNLWFLVVLRLLMPVTPQSPVSVFNLAPRTATQTVQAIPVVSADATIAASGQPLAEASSRKATSPNSLVSWTLIVSGIWIAGASLLLGRIAWSTLRLSRAVRRMRTVDDPKVLALLDACCGEMSVRHAPRLLASEDLPAPALMGWRKPRLLLPAHVLAGFAPAELRLIVLHELAHLRRRDVAVNWLLALLQSLHWFNPVVWLAFARVRSDRELAADELVLTATAAPDRTVYGETIVKLLQTFSATRRARGSSPGGAAVALPGTIGILERAHPLRRRITMIAQFNATFARRRWSGLAACSMIALAALTLTDAVRGQDTPRRGATQPGARAATRLTGSLIEDAAAATAAAAAAVNPQRGEDDAERLFAHFHKRIPELRFDSVPFHEVVEFLRDVAGVNIVVNWRALEAAGIDRNTVISQRLRDVSLEQALRTTLRELGGGAVAIAFSIDGGAIVISTLEELSKSPRTRAYDVADLLANTATTRPRGQDDLTSLLTNNVAKDQWTNTSAFTMGEFDNKLVISTLDMYHLEIERLLGSLRRGEARPTAAAPR